MRAVLDTVIFVRALINPKGRWGHLLFELSDRYTIVLSPDIISEIITVLYRPALRKRLPRLAELPELERVLQLFEEAEVVEPTEDIPVCRDPSDDKFFACALSGQAAFIVSEDKDILAVAEFRGVRCVTAGEFIAALQQDTTTPTRQD
jgi:putative PIN family toxin of toxin-antitoxin system